MRLKRRNSGIELLKLFSILLIIVSHITQTLHSPNMYVLDTNYIFDFTQPVADWNNIILVMLRHSGALGNAIFFISSAWFLLDSKKADKKKILHMLLDVLLISILIYIYVDKQRYGMIEHDLLYKQFLPTTFSNNWYVTAYLIFYPLHPFLNIIIDKISRKSLFRLNLFLGFMYIVINHLNRDLLFYSHLILWITIYLIIAYAKKYTPQTFDSGTLNRFLVIIGFVCGYGTILASYLYGLNIDQFSMQALRWNNNCNPFLIMIAIGLFNLFRKAEFHSVVINYLSSLSLLVYIIHENSLIRSYYRPLMWRYVYNSYGYDYVIIWVFVQMVMIFLISLVASIIYHHTLQKITKLLAYIIHPILSNIYVRIERIFLKLK